MADCVALRQSSGYNDISLEIKNFLPKLPPLFPITSLQQYNSTKQAINNERGKVQNLKSKLDAAVAQLEAGGCSARSVGAGAPYGAIERIERELDLNTQTVEREWERTQEAQAATAQKAAATQNNAGTGVPGTAGTGPGATPAPAPSPTTVANATPTANTTATTTATGTSAPAAVPPTTGANANTATTTTGTGTTKPATVNPATGTAAPAAPATKPVPTTKGAPGTVEYISSLIAQKPTEAENILATACPDKAAAITKVKAILSNLGGAVAAQIPTAKAADGTAASAAAKSALSTELQSALSKVGTTLKSIEALDCAKQATGATPAAGATGPVATNPSADAANNTQSGVSKAQAQAKLKDTTNFSAKKDWRVRLSLSPGAEYLYKAKDPGILRPLQNTDGVIFPYTPNITISYNANYDPTSITHSNYKIYQYLNSSVDQVNITCDFTAQDTYEANYLLAVIHFFRSVTKMFYGKDSNPIAGTPPPLCYLFGLGEFQFNAHPLVVSSFTYSLPSEVDYIRADPSEAIFSKELKANGNRTITPERKKPSSVLLDAIEGSIKNSRLAQGVAKLGKVIGLDLGIGGNLEGPSFRDTTNFNSLVPPGTTEPTYVPTKLQIQLTCIPIVSRYDISNRFSLKDYAQGTLLQGVKQSGGGIW